MNPQNFRRWLERIQRVQREADRIGFVRAQAHYGEWNAEPYRHSTRLMVERLCAELNHAWRRK